MDRNLCGEFGGEVDGCFVDRVFGGFRVSGDGRKDGVG